MFKLEYKKFSLIEIYIFCVLLSFNITNLLVVPMGRRTIHIHHIVTFVFFIWTVVRFKRLHLKINMLIMFYLFSLLISVIFAFRYGVGSTIANVVYCLILFSIVSAWADEINRERIYSIIQIVGYIFAVSIAINLIIQWRMVIYSFEVKAAHLLVTVLVAGGINIEATVLATYACFMLYKKKYGYWIFSLLISVLYSSRIAILLNILNFGLYSISYFKTRDKKSLYSLKKKHTIILLSAFIVIIVGLYYKGYFNHVIHRFLNIGKDAGSSERIQLWSNSLKVFIANPFGVGVGNAITYANMLNEEPINLGNIHCVYLQVLVETGVAGLILFIMSMYEIIKEAFLQSFSEPLSTMLLGYLFCCIIQFGGIEPLYILLWALFMLEHSKTDDEIRKLYNRDKIICLDVRSIFISDLLRWWKRKSHKFYMGISKRRI